MKYIIYILILLFVICSLFVAYVIAKIKEINYSFAVKSFLPKKVDLSGTSIVNVELGITIKSPFFFSVPVRYLYYEIYYNNNLLGKSNDTTGFTLKANDSTPVFQSIDVYIDKNNIPVIQNYLFKKPTDYMAKIYVNVFGLSLKLKDIKFTY